MLIIKTAKDYEPKEWARRWFNIRLDQFQNIGFMTVDTLNLLNTMCGEAELKNLWLHQINSDYRALPPTGQHPLGRAVDIVFFEKTPGDVAVDEQFKFALQYPWGGIGVYPYWNAPGLHVDTRQGIDHIALWYQEKDKSYRSIAEYEKKFGWDAPKGTAT